LSITTNEHGNNIYHVLSTSCVFNWYRKPTIDPLGGIYLWVENRSLFMHTSMVSVFKTNDDKIDTNFHNNIVYIWTYKLSYVFDLIWFIVLNATFSNISAILCMATSFSVGGSRSTRREPPTRGKQLVNFIICGCESSAPFFVITKPDAFQIC
jgi:hypothetical protein